MDAGKAGDRRANRTDEAQAVRFLLGKSAIFMVLPLVVAVLVAYFSLAK